MIDLTVALIVFLFPLAYSPGPGNIFFAANGARFGLRATLPAHIGYHIATWIVTVAIGLGFAVALERFPALFVWLKWAGSAYVLYLAWRFFRAGAVEADGAARPASFADGVILLVLNPKAYAIITLMFSQFLDLTQPQGIALVGWIATVFTLNNLVAFLTWTAIGNRIAALFRDQTSARWLNTGFGLILAGVAFWMMSG